MKNPISKLRIILSLIIYINLLFGSSVKAEINSFYLSQNLDSLIKNAISVNDTKYLQTIVNKYGPNYFFKDSLDNILTYCIKQNRSKAVRLLLKNNADINLLVNDFTPLMISALNGNVQIANLLISGNANVNKSNSVNNTALIIASRYGETEIMKCLIKHDANPFLRNQTFQNALDYALAYKKNKAVVLLRRAMKEYARRNLPATTDGPFVFKEDRNKLKVCYLHHDGKKNKMVCKRKVFNMADSTFVFSGFQGDTNNYQINQIQKPTVDKFINVSKTFVVGDVHGEYTSLLNLLKANKIINNKHDWTWGNGHLVFMGDIFDRGEFVTEIIWLIYKLEQQAKKKGGAVHYILGNHEIMVLTKDYRFVNDKYIYLSNAVGIDYSYLFSKESILGKWLRERKTALVIDSVLFVHAGFSVDLVRKEISLSKINETVKGFLNTDGKDTVLAETNFLMGDKGPFWYRGYFRSNRLTEPITDEDLDFILQCFSVKKVVVGHTEVKEIQQLYQKKVVPVNVPFNRNNFKPQGLCIINGRMYRCYFDGSITEI